MEKNLNLPEGQYVALIHWNINDQPECAFCGRRMYGRYVGIGRDKYLQVDDCFCHESFLARKHNDELDK